MAINLSTITGATVPGFTSPTYTVVTDTAPSNNSKQYAVSAVGGTQAGVDAHTVSKPFTVTFFRPAQLRSLPVANPVTGVIKSVPLNTYKVITRKGAVPASAQAPVVARITTTIDVQSGTETFDSANIKALLSAHIGALSQQSQGITDTVVTGIL